jgi:transcription initiation factor TFIIIB Brf1 subunit/transcription initiation factor TFIIB
VKKSECENILRKVEVRNVKNTNKKAKMAEFDNYIVCNFCQEEVDKDLFDDRDTVQSCPQCGSVFSEEQVYSYEIAFAKNTNTSLKGFFETPKYGYESRDQQRKLRPSLSTYTKNQLKTVLTRSCEKLQLSKEITEQTQNFLLEKAYPSFIHMQKKIRLVGACIYIICRNNDVTVTPKQVAVVTGCTVFELGNVAKKIDEAFGLHRTPITIQSLITTACSDLPHAMKCEELAQALSRRCSESLLLNGSPLPQAIAICVLASLAVNKGTKQRQEIAKLCLKMSQVSEITVTQCIRALKNYMVTLLQAIPWVDMKYVKMSNIQYYIKDILKYEQKCGKFPAKVANPQWCHKRETEIRMRKEKIQNALERVRLRQCPTMCATSGKDNGLAATEKLFDAENNLISEVDSPVAADTTLNTDSTGLNNSVATDTMLDEEDKVIEELLELGCSAQQLQEGFYENLRTTSSPLNHEIQESEIESYVRKPDEVNKLKRVAETDSGNFEVKRTQCKSIRCRTKPLNVNTNEPTR